LEGFQVRKAIPEDIAVLNELVRESVLGLGAADYSPEQLASALRYLFGIDSRLVEDGTYYVVEAGKRPVASGGWSRRRTLFGGDQYAARADDLLDPQTEPARVRAFFVHPDWARRGLGRLLLLECEGAASRSGFHRLELMATLTGVPLYGRAGFRILTTLELELPDGVRFPLARMVKEI
jgi:GNAT superfamily N-acetyltransferase